MFVSRKYSIQLFRKSLKEKTGRSWSVSGGRGTGFGWIDIQAPPKRRVCHDENGNDRPPKPGEIAYYTSTEDCKVLATAFGMDRPAHFQGLSISSDERSDYLKRLGAIEEYNPIQNCLLTNI